MQIFSQTSAKIVHTSGVQTPSYLVFIKLIAASVGGLLVLATAALFIGILI